MLTVVPWPIAAKAIILQLEGQCTALQKERRLAQVLVVRVVHFLHVCVCSYMYMCGAFFTCTCVCVCLCDLHVNMYVHVHVCSCVYSTYCTNA